MQLKPLSGAFAKIERAHRHIEELKREAQTFHDSRPYELYATDEPETGDRYVRVRVKAQVPILFGTIIGEIIHNLRAALDQAAWELVISNGGNPTNQIYFPIGKDERDLELSIKAKLMGASEKSKNTIRKIRPFRGGNDSIWKVHALDILDKHRAIIPVGSCLSHVTFDFTRLMRAMPGWSDLPTMPIAIRPADRLFPLKDGAAVLHHKAGTISADDNPTFTFDIAFGEGQIVDGEPVLPTLQELTDAVAGAIGTIMQECFAPVQLP